MLKVMAASTRIEHVILIAYICLALPSHSAPKDPWEQFRRNRSKLVVTIATDRLEYFPGELADLTLTVENRTPRALEVPDPLTYWFGVVSLEERCPDSYYRRVGIDPDRSPPLEPSPMATRKMKPGEALVTHLRSFDQKLTNRVYVMPYFGAAPDKPGEYRLMYWTAQADFRVVVPLFEGMIRIPWSAREERRYGIEPDQKRLEQKFVHAFLLASGGKHFLCLDKRPFAGKINTKPADSTGRLNWSEFHLNRYSRIAESDTPIAGLIGESDQSGNVQLTWGEQNQRKVVVRREDLIFDRSRGE
jgi:hypothetical protein